MNGTDIISVTLNDTGAERTGTITYTSGDATPVVVTVTQSAQDTLTVEPTTIAFDSTGTPAQTITVTTSADTFTATASDAWITILEGDGDFTVTLANNTGEARSGTITVNAGTANEVTITVTQAAQISLDVTPTALTFGYDGTETQSVDVSTTGELYTATPSEDWITVTVDPVADTFHVEVEPHKGQDLRMAMITVNDDLENEQEVSVEQLFPPFTHKIEIDLSKEVMRFGPDSTWETQVAEILTAVDYDDLISTSDDNWITCEIVNVSGRYEVKVSCVPNTKDNETGGLERTGYVYVGTLSGNGYPAKLTVIQGKKW